MMRGHYTHRTEQQKSEEKEYKRMKHKQIMRYTSITLLRMAQRHDRSTSEWREIFGNSIQPRRALQHWRWAWEQKGIIKINILFLSIVILVCFFFFPVLLALYTKRVCVSLLLRRRRSFIFSGRNLLSFTNFVTSVLCSARGWVIRPVQSRRKHFGKCNKNTQQSSGKKKSTRGMRMSKKWEGCL